VEVFLKALRVWFVILVSFALATPARPAQAPEPSPLERLRAVVAEAAAASTGDMGVAIKHVETGQELAVNGDRFFPMASTVKVPILVELFNQVDSGKIRLDEMVSLDPYDLHLGSGQLKDYIVPGVALSMENLARLMMRISDNTATDIVLERVGIDHVNDRLSALGIADISVNRSTQDLIMDQMGFQDWNTEGMTHEELMAKLNGYEVAPGELEWAAARFDLDNQDTATPVAMNLLLEKILVGQAASPQASTKMVGIMLECETGLDRIRGLLPSTVSVAHKTGTIGGTVNDVGIVFLPEGRGHILLSVLSKGAEDQDKVAHAIAEIARYAYDYFLFTAPESAEAEGDLEASGSVLSVP
jgi:beta-lactamase class A